MKIFVARGSFYAAKWIEDSEIVFELEDKPDLVVFPGGTDINPRIYGEKPHPKTDHPDENRDKEEIELVQYCTKHRIPMFGICRGAQLLCAMAGGKLVQHQENRGQHKLHVERPYEDGEGSLAQVQVTSCHHQAQWPWSLRLDEFSLIGWTYNRSNYHQNGRGEEIVNGAAHLCQWGGGRSGNNLLEVEDVYYPRINALAVQCHPEWMMYGSYEAALFHYRKLVKMLVNNKL